MATTPKAKEWLDMCRKQAADTIALQVQGSKYAGQGGYPTAFLSYDWPGIREGLEPREVVALDPIHARFRGTGGGNLGYARVAPDLFAIVALGPPVEARAAVYRGTSQTPAEALVLVSGNDATVHAVNEPESSPAGSPPGQGKRVAAVLLLVAAAVAAAGAITAAITRGD